MGRIDHKEIVTVRHLHLRQRLRMHHVLRPNDAVDWKAGPEVQLISNEVSVLG